MLKTKVSCWFCNKESQVFILNKNSWTCEHCEQYNGFKKDGDYNKKIPEMESDASCDSRKSYCTTATYAEPSVNLLCDKCNRNQELKLADLNKFEPKNEDHFEEEYRIYKLKLDQIYGLCHQCNLKLNNHLKKQDLQIGDYVVKNRRSTLVTSNALKNSKAMNKQTSTTTQAVTIMASATMKENKRQSTLLMSQRKVANKHANEEDSFKKRHENELLNFTNDNDESMSQSPVKTMTKKAHTVAGTVSPAFNNLKQKFYHNGNAVKANVSGGSSFLSSHEEEDKRASFMNDLPDKTRKGWNSVSMSSLSTIFIDLLVLFLVIMTFSCDLCNLINDSGVFADSDSDLATADDDASYFATLLTIYKYKKFIFSLMVILSARIFYKRPRVSRFVMLSAFVFGLFIHMDIFDSKLEEQFILEVIVSFFLASYLMMARVYNLVQFIRSF